MRKGILMAIGIFLLTISVASAHKNTRWQKQKTTLGNMLPFIKYNSLM